MENVKWLSSQKINDLSFPLQAIGSITGNVKNIIIALHGYGDNAANFAAVGTQVFIKDVLWIFVKAPKNVPMSFDGGQWFSLFGDPSAEIEFSQNMLSQIIDTLVEKTGLSTSKIFLLGFSQGAAMALACGLKLNKPFAGLIALSGFLLEQSKITQILKNNPSFPPIFIGHGLEDQVVFPAFFYEMKNTLEHLGAPLLRVKTYPMGHTFCVQEVVDIQNFIEEVRS